MPMIGGSSFSVLLLNGASLLAAKVQAFTWKVANLLERTDGLGDSWDEHTPTGHRVGTVTQEGAFFDTTTGSMHAQFSAGSLSNRTLVWAPAGNTIGAIFVGAQGTFQGVYDVIAKLRGLTKANATYLVSGQVDEGVIVQDHVVKTVDWNTKTDGFPVDYTLDVTQRVIPITSNSIANPTVVTTPVVHGLTTGDIILIADVATSSPTINGQRTVTVISTTTFSVPVNVTVAGTGGTFVRANSSAGAVGYQAISQMAGFSGFVGTIRDSPDDITYTSLLGFSNQTSGPVAERLTVAGVIDRYLSFDGNVTGSGTITVFAGLKRN